MMMHLTLPTSTGEIYSDKGHPMAVLGRLRRTCPRGGTLIQAATAARSASVRARRGALRALTNAARIFTSAGDQQAADRAIDLSVEIRAEGLMSCHLPALRAIIAHLTEARRRAA